MVKESSHGSHFGLFSLGPLAKTCSGLSFFGTMASQIVMWDPPCIAGLLPILYIHKLADESPQTLGLVENTGDLTMTSVYLLYSFEGRVS